MAQALYRKWRSQTFDELVGQEHVTTTLRNALRDERVAHAYLFAGPRGTGKTSTARILAKALNCTAPEEQRPCNECTICKAVNEGRLMDLVEIDAASNNSVDNVRDLREKVGFRPAEGRYKIYIIDEVHMLSNSAFNALLKTLEEPPPHARFVLATTEPHKIPATVISRCQRFDFRRIPVPEIAEHLAHIAQEEGFSAEGEALTAIARSAQGCMRDAVSLLDQMLSYGHETVTLAQVQQALGAVNAQTVSDVVEALATKNIRRGLGLIQQLLIEGASLTEFCHQVVEHLRGVMVLQMTGEPTLLSDLPRDTIAQMQAQAQGMDHALPLFAIKRFSEALPELKGGYQPQLPLELALIEAIQGGVTTPQPLTVLPTMPATSVAPVPQPAVHGKTAPATESAPSSNGHQHPIVSAPAIEPVVPPALDAAAYAAAYAAAGGTDANSSPPDAPPLDAAAVKKMQTHYKEFLVDIREQCGIRVQAALKSVRDIAIAEQSVVFAFGNNGFSHDLISSPDTLHDVVSVLSNFLGRPVMLECQMGDKAVVSNLGRLAQTIDATGGLDALIEYAISALGAEVLDE